MPALFTAGLFVLLRRLERWLHQHLFKVGWLLTQNFQTTTILYYTFFLPGIIVHEVIYFLAAGILNVRADRTLQWPEAQEIGELRLNFVRIASRAGIYRKAIITAMPLIAGLFFIWHAAHNVFDIQAVVTTMSTGELDAVAAGFQQLTGVTDFWLWIYLVFTISNTMFPTIPKDLRGWRTIAGVAVLFIIVLTIIGLGSYIFEAVSVPLLDFLSELQAMLILVIGINLFMVLVLGTIEYAIESITDRSATFKNGKMITMTREEAIAERQKQRERERRRAQRQQRQTSQPINVSVYRLSFPVPGAPGDEIMTHPDEMPDTPVEERLETVITGTELDDATLAPDSAHPPPPPESTQSTDIRFNLPGSRDVAPPDEADTTDSNLPDSATDDTAQPADDSKNQVAWHNLSGAGQPLNITPARPPVSSPQIQEPVPDITDDGDADISETPSPQPEQDAALSILRKGTTVKPSEPDKPATTEPDVPHDEDESEADDTQLESSGLTESTTDGTDSISDATDSDSDEDEDEHEDEGNIEDRLAALRDRFPAKPPAISPFRDDTSQDDSTEDDDDKRDESANEAAINDALASLRQRLPAKPPAISPFRDSSPNQDDDDIDDDDESILRRDRAEVNSALDALFKDTRLSEDSNPDTASSLDRFRRPASSRPASSLLSGKLSPVPGSEDSTGKSDKPDDEKPPAKKPDTGSLSGLRGDLDTSSSFSFGTSRPVPKPSSDTGDDSLRDSLYDDDENDEEDIIYEDIDDPYYDYDDDGDTYLDYDDDEDFSFYDPED